VPIAAALTAARLSARSAAQGPDKRCPWRSPAGRPHPDAKHSEITMTTPRRDLWDNPMGTDGFEFIEYTGPDPQALGALFERIG